jgi:hypothetical protein
MGSTMMFSPTVKGMEIMDSPLTGNGGLVFRYAGNKVCAVQVELNYMQRGWKEKWMDNQGAEAEYQRQLDYIELPLLMHLYFGKRCVRAFVNLGPQIGYCIRDISSGIPNPQYSHQYAKIDNPFDWGLTGGLGLYCRTRKIGLFQIEARMNYSLGSAFKTNLTDYFTAANHMNVSINFAYLWEVKIK